MTTPDAASGDGDIGPGASTTATADAAMLRPPGDPTPDRSAATASGRPADGRLARLHLRGGLLPLARAELETMAGQGTLDRVALADLAEVRWRGGDLVGAGEAAQAHVDAGGDDLMALVILAEALDASGHGADARRYAAEAVRRAGLDLDDLFAGHARSRIWPAAGPPDASRTGHRPGRYGLLAGGAELGAADAAARDATVDPAWAIPPALDDDDVAPAPHDAARPRDTIHTTPAFGAAAAMLAGGPPGSTVQAVDIGQAAGRELEAVEELVGRGELTSVAERLGLLLRVDPALAPVILTLADAALVIAADGGVSAALHLLRGDAYRSLGRDIEATEAYRRSMDALAARARPPREETT